MTESLFLLLTAGSFYAAKRQCWWLAGVAGGLASATRITGVLLLPALLIESQTYRSNRRRLNLLWLLLIPAGLLTFMYFLYRSTGNPLAFKDIMVVWGRRPGVIPWPLIAYLKQPLLLAIGWDFRLLNFIALALAILCSVALIKWRWWSMACYAITALLVMLASGVLQSQARYVMVLFPVFIVLGHISQNGPFQQVILTVSLILLCLTTLFFSYGITFALS
jgi:hypothetical protein